MCPNPQPSFPLSDPPRLDSVNAAHVNQNRPLSLKWQPKAPSSYGAVAAWTSRLQRTLGWETASCVSSHLGFFRALIAELDATGACFVPGLGCFWLALRNVGVGKPKQAVLKFRADKFVYRSLGRPFTDPRLHWEPEPFHGKRSTDQGQYDRWHEEAKARRAEKRRARLEAGTSGKIKGKESGEIREAGQEISAPGAP